MLEVKRKTGGTMRELAQSLVRLFNDAPKDIEKYLNNFTVTGVAVLHEVMTMIENHNLQDEVLQIDVCKNKWSELQRQIDAAYCNEFLSRRMYWKGYIFQLDTRLGLGEFEIKFKDQK